MRRSLQILLIASSGLALVACDRGPSASDPLPVAQMRAAFQKSFASADSATREMVNKFVDEAEKNQVADAYADINELMTLRTLTKDQGITVARASATMSQIASEAAQAGDQQTAETMRATLRKH